MRCFSCGKKFDYEKYYGICPKCGCFNKTETSQEQHQRYHDAYDGGYRHSEHIQPRVREKKSGRGSTIFLIVSIVVFILVSCVGTALSFVYRESQEKKLQQEVIESSTKREEHAIGESFSLQGMTLAVREAYVLDEGWVGNHDIPRGKKLVAVRLSGTSDGEWADKNQLWDAYIRYDGLCYWQISTYDFDEYEEKYGVCQFDRYTLCRDAEGEGCLVFWVDEDEMEFTLCLEERAEENSAFIQTIHSVEIYLEEEQVE